MRVLLRAAAAAAFGLVAAAGSAGEPSALLGSTPWREEMGRWLDGEVAQQLQSTTAGLPLRAEIEVGTLDPRLQLAPCQRVQPYLPAGTRLWGRSRIGLRCVDGSTTWNVFLPIHVRVWGPGWVVRRPVASGETLGPEHAEATEVDWTAHREAVLVRPQDWQGMQAVRGLGAGQVLRAGMVRMPQVFESGSTVRLRLEGPGFVVMATGEALGHGRIGEPVRVRLPNRRILVGTVLDAQTVALNL